MTFLVCLAVMIRRGERPALGARGCCCAGKAGVPGESGFQFFRTCGRKLCETFSTS